MINLFAHVNTLFDPPTQTGGRCAWSAPAEDASQGILAESDWDVSGAYRKLCSHWASLLGDVHRTTSDDLPQVVTLHGAHRSPCLYDYSATGSYRFACGTQKIDAPNARIAAALTEDGGLDVHLVYDCRGDHVLMDDSVDWEFAMPELRSSSKHVAKIRFVAAGEYEPAFTDDPFQ